MVESKPVVVIMAGGSGTRFWPLSTKAFPKQFLSLIGEESLLEATLNRSLEFTAKNRIFVCGLQSHKKILMHSFDEDHLILEPQGRNTAACLMLTASMLQKKNTSKDDIIIVFPADHLIVRNEMFAKVMREAVSLARKTQGLITLGIKPSFAHTGYGYIEADVPVGEDFNLSYKVARFIEKPNKSKASELVSSGRCYWNAGIFVFSLGAIIRSFEKFLPESWANFKLPDADPMTFYDKLISLPIDIAVMEKADNVYTVFADIQWNDLGSWSALYDLSQKDSNQNALISGHIKTVNSKNCLVKTSAEKKVALVGVENLVIVETKDALLILDKKNDQWVKEAAQYFES